MFWKGSGGLGPSSEPRSFLGVFRNLHWFAIFFFFKAGNTFICVGVLLRYVRQQNRARCWNYPISVNKLIFNPISCNDENRKKQRARFNFWACSSILDLPASQSWQRNQWTLYDIWSAVWKIWEEALYLQVMLLPWWRETGSYK